MAVTEQPVDIVSTRNGGTFVLGNHALRSSWINSFYVSVNPNLTYIGEHSTLSLLGYGAVKDSNGTTHDQIGYDNLGSVTTFPQIYVQEIRSMGAIDST